MFDKASWVPEICQNNLEKTAVEDHKVDEEIIGQIKNNAKILSFSSKTKQITKDMLKESASLKEKDNLTLFNAIPLIPYILYLKCFKKDFVKERDKYVKRKLGFKP